MKMKTVAIVLAMSLSVTSATAQAQGMPEAFNPQRIRSAIQTAAGAAFNKIDSNGDGRLTRDEASLFARSRGATARPMDNQTWLKSDQNRDGTISRGEFMAAVMTQFDMPALISNQSR